MYSPPSAVSVPSARAPAVTRCTRRVAVAADDVLVAARDGAADRAARTARELGREQDVVPDAVLRPEAAAHELADDADPVGRQTQPAAEVVPEPPDVLRGDVDVEPVAAPLADALVRLERVVVERLRRVDGLDDRVGFREAALEVAALVAARVREERAPSHRLLGVDQRLQLLPLDVDQPHCGGGLRERLGGDRGDRAPLVVGLGVHAIHLAGPDRGEHSGCGECRCKVDSLHARTGVRAPEQCCVGQPGQAHVARVARDSARPLVAVEARRGPSDDRARARRPLVESVLLDERPHLLVAALDLLLGLDQPRHVEMASSIRG